MIVDEHTEVLFNFLIDTLRLPVCLGMIGCGWVGFDGKESIEFFHEARLKLSASVMDELLRYTMAIEDVVAI